MKKLILLMLLIPLTITAAPNRTELVATTDSFDTNGNPITINFVNMYCGPSSGNYTLDYPVTPVGTEAALSLTQLPDGTYYCNSKQESNGVEGAYSGEIGPFRVAAGQSPADGTPVAPSAFRVQ